MPDDRCTRDPATLLTMPTFSRAQLGTMLLVAALFLGLYAGRGYLGWLPFHSTGATRPVALVEINGEVAHPGVYAFPGPPTLSEAWRRAAGPEPVPASAAAVPSQTRPRGRPGGRVYFGAHLRRAAHDPGVGP